MPSKHASAQVPFAATDATNSRSEAVHEPSDQTKLAALVGLQPVTSSLFSAWLGEHRWHAAELDHLPGPPDVIIVEVSFPRVESPVQLSTVSDGYPGVPVIVVSPTIVAGTPSRGDVAQQLGVAAVLGMPVSRTALLATVDDLTGRG
jgi:hypothetical protein